MPMIVFFRPSRRNFNPLVFNTMKNISIFPKKKLEKDLRVKEKAVPLQPFSAMRKGSGEGRPGHSSLKA